MFPPRANAARLPVCRMLVNENDNPNVRGSCKNHKMIAEKFVIPAKAGIQGWDGGK
jgi:hypothetical protein